MYTYMHVRIDGREKKNTYIYTPIEYAYRYISIYICIYLHIYVRILKYTHTHIDIYICIHICMYIYRLSRKKNTRIYIHIYTYQPTNADLNNICSVWDNLHVYTHASMYIHITYTYFYIYMCRFHM